MPRSLISNRGLLVSVLVVGLTGLLFAVTPIDWLVQDWLYDFSTRQWLIDKRAPVPRWLFYSLPKVGLIVFAVALLGMALGPAPWRERWGLSRREIWLVIASLAIVPAMISVLRDASRMHCPWHLRRYGGTHDERVEPIGAAAIAGRRKGGGCCPAAHASGGFALMSVAFLSSKRKNAWGGLMLGLTMGWAMGLYQMAKGAHFLSHTVATMFIAWFIVAVLARVLSGSFSSKFVAYRYGYL